MLSFEFSQPKRSSPNSIQTLVKISKTAGARLKPHAARLIPALLEALSTLEPQVLNYLSLRATEQEKVTSRIFQLLTQSFSSSS